MNLTTTTEAGTVPYRRLAWSANPAANQAAAAGYAARVARTRAVHLRAVQDDRAARPLPDTNDRHRALVAENTARCETEAADAERAADALATTWQRAIFRLSHEDPALAAEVYITVWGDQR